MTTDVSFTDLLKHQPQNKFRSEIRNMCASKRDKSCVAMRVNGAVRIHRKIYLLLYKSY